MAKTVGKCGDGAGAEDVAAAGAAIGTATSELNIVATFGDDLGEEDRVVMTFAVAGLDSVKVIGMSAGAGFGRKRARRPGAKTYAPKHRTINPQSIRNSLLIFTAAL